MDEVHSTTRDDNGSKAHGVLAALENFETFFCLKFGHLVFGATEEVSKCLQAKATTLQEVLTTAIAVNPQVVVRYSRVPTEAYISRLNQFPKDT